MGRALRPIMGISFPYTSAGERCRSMRPGPVRWQGTRGYAAGGGRRREGRGGSKV